MRSGLKGAGVYQPIRVWPICLIQNGSDGAVSRAVSIVQDRREFLCVHMKTISIALCRTVSSIAKARVIAAKKK